MKKIFFVLTCTMLFLSSCGGDSAMKVNETIVNKVDATVTKVDKISSLVESDDYDAALAQLDSVSLYVTNAETTIGALSTKSGEEFKTTSLAFLAFVKSDVIPAYTKAIGIYRTAENNTQMSEANNLINDITDKANEKHDALNKAQEAFAKANNMDLR